MVSVNEAERLVTVQPGIINQDLKDHLAPYGLSYPPDPGSAALSSMYRGSTTLSSIGENIAANAGGLCCAKFGVTRDYVRSLKVVLADGTLTTLGPETAKRVVGLDMRHLFIGSEGTLGIVVEATLRMINDFGDFGLDDEAGAMLILQVDANPADSEVMVESIAEVARDCGATDVAYSDDPADSAALITARRMIRPAYEKFAHAHGGGQLLDDICLP